MADPHPATVHDGELEPRPTETAPDVPKGSPPLPTGQLETFAMLGAMAGGVPLPWLPSALARRVRGAMVQDVAARHGLGLTSDARLLLAEPTVSRSSRGPMAQAFGYLGRKLLVRFGPLGVLPPLRAALETYVLGYLFDRYLTRARREVGNRVERDEARFVRHAIERAVLEVVSPARALDWPATKLPPDDARDEVTQAVDGLLSATTTVPSWLLERLAAAFDETSRPAGSR